MDSNVQWHNEMVGKKAVAALQKNKFSAAYFPDAPSAVEHLLSLVADGASVGLGGSITGHEISIREKLREKGCTLFDHQQQGLSPEESLAMRHNQLSCKVFICGTNALTMQGELVNVDGIGNRVGAMIFGPERVIIVTGINKIVKDLNAAQQRIKDIAAPCNNKRLNLPNPCTQTGQCMDCQSDRRICNVTTILHRRPSLTDMHVIVIGESLGY